MGSFYQQPPMRRGAQVSTSAVGLGGMLSAVASTVTGGAVGSKMGGGGSDASSSSFLGFFGGSGSGKTSPMVTREELDRIAAHRGGMAAAV